MTAKPKTAAIPALHRVRQRAVDAEISGAGAAVAEALSAAKLKPRARVAVLAGSRGIDRIAEVIAAVADVLKAKGARPFVLAAMGSHGGATPEGRLKALSQLGITPKNTGAPVLPGGRTRVIGEVRGVDVHVAAEALGADAVISVNRIKPHTSFSGRYESGLAKMLAVGLGHEKSATAFHARGAGELAGLLPDLASVVLQRLPVLMGLALIENGRDRLCEIKAIPASRLLAEEPKLLARARRLRPMLPFAEADVLVVDCFGKDLSGAGMDTNVIGRLFISGQPEPKSPRLRRIVALRLSPGANGNAYGIGLADVTTVSVIRAMNPAVTRANVMASTFIERARVPIHFPSDREAILAAIATCGNPDPRALRLARIRDTLHLETLLVSKTLLAEIEDRVEIETGPLAWRFDRKGDLKNLTSHPSLRG